MATGFAVYGFLHVALLVAAERSRTIRNPLYADKEHKLTLLERTLPMGSPLVLVLGTSRTGNAVDAGRAQALLNENRQQPVAVFNWGLPATGPITHFLHLRQLLADGHRPSLVVLEILPPTFASVPDGPYEWRCVTGTPFNDEEIDWLGKYGFPVARFREEWRSAQIAPWWGMRFPIGGRLFPNALPFHQRHDWSRNSDEFGWRPLIFETLTPEQEATGLAQARTSYADMLAELKPGEDTARALRDMLALCRENDIRVVLLWMPEGTTFRAMYPPEVDAQFSAFLGRMAAETGCTFTDARTWLPDDAFADGHHIMRHFAGVFTDRLTREVIAPHLDATTGGSR